ncbi:MAG: hypothetical protein ACFWT6_19575 [Virgibacillus proomii]
MAASANLPVILYTIYWKRFNAYRAVTAMAFGMLSSLILISISPNMFSPVDGKGIFIGAPIFPLTNPAIISVPFGFLGGYLGTLLSKEKDVRQFAKVQVKANTGYRE